MFRAKGIGWIGSRAYRNCGFGSWVWVGLGVYLAQGELEVKCLGLIQAVYPKSGIWAVLQIRVPFRGSRGFRVYRVWAFGFSD